MTSFVQLNCDKSQNLLYQGWNIAILSYASILYVSGKGKEGNLRSSVLGYLPKRKTSQDLGFRRKYDQTSSYKNKYLGYKQLAVLELGHMWLVLLFNLYTLPRSRTWQLTHDCDYTFFLEEGSCSRSMIMLLRGPPKGKS